MTIVQRQAIQPPGLEEDIEFSNVTHFRDSLLTAVEHLRENPAKRYVITKHGQPEAVLMSFQTYSLLRRVMDRELARIPAPQTSSEAASAAFARLRVEQHDASGESPEVRAVREQYHSVRSQLDLLGKVLERGKYLTHEE